VWKSRLPLKLKVFAWQAFQGVELKKKENGKEAKTAISVGVLKLGTILSSHA
jgi:hypothetical protein